MRMIKEGFTKVIELVLTLEGFQILEKGFKEGHVRWENNVWEDKEWVNVVIVKTEWRLTWQDQTDSGSEDQILTSPMWTVIGRVH